MRNSIDNIFRSLIDSKEEINILYFPYDGIFEQSLMSSKCKYYTMVEHQIYPSARCIYPDNFHLLEDGILSYTTKLDLVVANHRKDQLSFAKSFSDKCHIPLVLIDHELPAEDSSPKLRMFVGKQFSNDRSICFDNLVTSEWFTDIRILCNYGASLLPGLGNENLPEKKNDVCFIGDHSPNDSNMISEIVKMHPKIVSLGRNHGVTQEYKSFENLLELMYSSRIGIQTIQDPRPPLLMLYSMSMGCVPIINNTRWTDIWLDDSMGIRYTDVNTVKKHVDDLLKDETRLAEMSAKCINFVNSRFNLETFTELYESFIDNSTMIMYDRESTI